MSKTLVIDIGTHEAQEIRVLSGDRSYLILQYSKWWFDWLKRQIKKIMRHKGIIKYNRGAYVSSPLSYSYHLACLKQIFYSKNYLLNTKLLSIDPVVSITAKYIDKLNKKINIDYLPIAILPHDSKKDSSNIIPFYITKNSLSSSIYNVKGNEQKIMLCPAFSFDQIINKLKEYGIIDSATKVLVRMNCEGSELGIIKCLIACDIIPNTILGSIHDVEKKHGLEAASEMKQILEKNEIQFFYFKGSDPATWYVGFETLNRLNIG